MENSILLNVLLFYAILFLTTFPAPFLGLKFDEGDANGVWFAPPGFVIVIVWWILFTLLGVAHYYVLRAQNGEKLSGNLLLIGLAVLCATYVYYTIGLESLTGISSLWFGLFGNLTVILAAAFVVFRLYPIASTAAFLTIPVIVWTSFATLIVIAEMKSARLI